MVTVTPTAAAAVRLSPATGEAAAAAAAAAATSGAFRGVKKPMRSLAEAKRELLHLFSLSSAGKELTSDEKERAGFLLETLEDNYTPIQTIGFFNLAVQVCWFIRKLVCSSSERGSSGVRGCFRIVLRSNTVRVRTRTYRYRISDERGTYYLG